MTSRLHRRTPRARFEAYLRQHSEAIRRAIGNLSRAPLSNLLTLLVLAIALALPSALYTAVINLKSAFDQWDGRQISVFIKRHLDDQQLPRLAQRLRDRDDIAEVQVMTREQSLEEFRRSSGLGSALDLLDENPLPAVLVVRPENSVSDSAQLQALSDELRALPEADQVVVDQEWLDKLFALVVTVERVIVVVTLFFGVLLALVVTLVLRLELIRRRGEIEVIKLVGGSDAYIQRPFLYTALLLGTAAAILALIIVWMTFSALREPLSHFLTLYGGEVNLQLPFNVVFGLVAGTALISLLAAWGAMKVLLWRIEPA